MAYHQKTYLTDGQMQHAVTCRGRQVSWGCIRTLGILGTFYRETEPEESCRFVLGLSFSSPGTTSPTSTMSFRPAGTLYFSKSRASFGYSEAGTTKVPPRFCELSMSLRRKIEPIQRGVTACSYSAPWRCANLRVISMTVSGAFCSRSSYKMASTSASIAIARSAESTWPERRARDR